ncbi:MAG: hypothetical protein HY039_04355 [Nitrospirae bacterium]|nr:hypothetical protein [Nitrospirota bacterium]
MDWIGLLQKLGILRYGTKSGTYTSGKEMPAEFLMDGVYNSEKDLVHKEDLRASPAPGSGTAETERPAQEPPGRKAGGGKPS